MIWSWSLVSKTWNIKKRLKSSLPINFKPHNDAFDKQLKRFLPPSLECLDWNINRRWQCSWTELGIFKCYHPAFLKQEKVSYASTGDA
jgi:hypothetical protein